MLGIMQVQSREIMPSKRACRSLFGPVNHDEVKKTLAREMEELDNRQKRQWNFDFKNEVPLAGKFHWERVNSNDTRVPVAYMLGHLEPKQAYDDVEMDNSTSETTEAIESAAETTLPEIGEPVIPSSPLPTTSQEDLQTLTETTPPSQVSRKRKRQSEITDFYPVTKVAKNDK